MHIYFKEISKLNSQHLHYKMTSAQNKNIMVSGTFLHNRCEPGHWVIQAYIPHIQEFDFLIQFLLASKHFKQRVQCI
jgi:hypothetical protein